MAVIETWFHQDLQKPVKVNYLDGNLFSNNGNGNRIGVVLTNNGEDIASISGTVSGYVVTADGSTVPCTGSKSGNRASILIPAAAYQPGSIFITVFVTDGTTVTTIGAVSTTVMRSRTNAQVDPGSTVTDWTQTINAAMQSVETAAENLGGIVAVPYASITFPVPLGKYTYYNNNLYRCISPIASSESFTAAHWTQVRLGDDVSDLKSAIVQDTSVLGIKDQNAKGARDYRGVVITGNSNIYNITGTATANLKAKLSDTIDSQMTASYPAGWSKTIPFEANKRYQINLNVLSGTIANGINIQILDESNNAVAAVNNTSKKAEFTWQSGNGMVYMYIPNGTATNFSISIVLYDITNDTILEYLYSGESNADYDLTTGGLLYYSQTTVGESYSIASSNSGKYAIIDVRMAQKNIIEMVVSSVVANSATGSCFVDSNGKVISKFVTSDLFALAGSNYFASINVPFNAVSFVLTLYNSSATAVEIKYVKTKEYDGIRYVSPNGSDSNSGLTIDSAFATITKAVNDGGHTILLAGGKYFQTINLSHALNQIEIANAEKDKLPVIYHPDSLIAESETQVSGYENVYSCPCSKTIDMSKNIWIFQEGVPDATTGISVQDMHPLQRGKAYRCDDTKISVCSSNNVSDALTEIENDTAYKFYYDSANSILYFSRPQTVSSTNPIMVSFLGGVFQNVFRGLKLKMTGIGIKYQGINLNNMIEPILTDCFCGNVFGGGAIIWDGACGAKLYRCEVYRAFYSTSGGDGFNAHSDNTNDPFAKQTGCFMFDCWAHDCCDDGYSDHERCEMTIYGGLFENNGAGVTPALGSHCTCYNVLARYNGESNFFYTGSPYEAEGGAGGQISCFNCVAQGNGTSTDRGYRFNGGLVQALLVNCIAMDVRYGFYSENTNETQIVKLINCTTSNVSTPTYGNAIRTVVNGTPISV